MGPWLTPAAYVSDPNNLSIKLWVNGVLKQDSNTSKMVHNTAEQIAYLSRHITLQPGDVIATGDVTLDSRSSITGDLTSAGSIQKIWRCATSLKRKISSRDRCFSPPIATDWTKNASDVRNR